MSVAAHARIEAALEQFSTATIDPVLLVRGLMDAIRPRNGVDTEEATANWRAMNELLAAKHELRPAVCGKVVELLATRRLLAFFADEGILPSTGFFTEFWHKLVHKFLPELLDERGFKDCLVLVFHESADYVWFNAVPIADKIAFWRNLDLANAPDRSQVTSVLEQLLESLLVVAHRTVALAFHPEFRRVCAHVEEQSSPFLALHRDLSAFAENYRGLLTGAESIADADGRVPKLIAACRVEVSEAYVATLDRGVSLALTYLLAQLDQLLDRLSLLHGLLAARGQQELRPQLQGELDTFLRTTVICETQRNSIRKHFSDLLGLLALRITESASRTGGHYITTGWYDYWMMWYSAMGAGIVVAVMALIKLSVSGYSYAPSGLAAVQSLLYGLGFVVIALLHFTLATKQPAMTAARIANAIVSTGGELCEDRRLVDLILDTLRSQLAAILGNVLLAMSTATLIAWMLPTHGDEPFIDEAGAQYLLKQLQPLQVRNLLYAGIAGVWLFVAGLLAGYFDNLAAYAQIGARIGRLRWLVALTGRDRAQRVGDFVHRNLGSLMANFLFGCLLGSTAAVGQILGLPLDVRHVTFSAANLAYALAGLHYQVPVSTLLQVSLGVALIGAINLTVSFTLALIVAMRSRNASLAALPSVIRHALQRLLRNPLRALLPPPRGAEGDTGTVRASGH